MKHDSTDPPPPGYGLFSRLHGHAEPRLQSWLTRLPWASHRLTVLLVVLIFLSALAFVALSGNELRYPDEIEYHNLAVRLGQGFGFVTSDLEPTAYRPPGYPFFLSRVYLIGAKPLYGKIANALLVALCAVVVFLLAERATRVGATLGLALIGLYPLFAYAAGTLFPQILGSVVFLLVILIATQRPLRHWRALVGGVLYGCAVLTIPAFLLVFPFFVIYVTATGDGSWAKRLSVSALLVVGLVVSVGPWTIRNWVAFDAFLPVSANAGENLLLGNSEHARANLGVKTDISRFRLMANDLGDVERDRFLRRKAVDWIRQNPGRAITLYALKVLNYFNFRNELRVEAEDTTLRQGVVFVTYYPLLLVAILRWLFVWRVRPTATELFINVLYFGNAFVSAVFFTRIRFRIPFDFLLIVLVAMFLGRLMEQGKSQQSIHTVD